MPQFESGESIGAMFDLGETRLDEGFEVADSIPIEMGRYKAAQARMFFNSSRHRAVYGDLRGSWQQFYGGTHWSAEVSISAAPNPQISVELSQEWNRVEVPNGEFTSNITSLRLGYAFSTKLFTNALFQYNSLNKDLSANLRFNFIHRPGSDLFVVLTERRGVNDRLWDLSNRGMVAKLTYLARL
jgi:hypothetical protein